MTEFLNPEPAPRVPFEKASRHLLETLRAYSPVELRDTPHTIVGDAQEYAEMTSAPVVLERFDDKALADASFAFGARSFKDTVNPDKVLDFLASSKFTGWRHTVWDHAPETDVRSLIFFSQGVKYAALLLRTKQLHDRRL